MLPCTSLKRLGPLVGLERQVAGPQAHVDLRRAAFALERLADQLPQPRQAGRLHLGLRGDQQQRRLAAALGVGRFGPLGLQHAAAQQRLARLRVGNLQSLVEHRAGPQVSHAVERHVESQVAAQPPGLGRHASRPMPHDAAEQHDGRRQHAQCQKSRHAQLPPRSIV